MVKKSNAGQEREKSGFESAAHLPLFQIVPVAAASAPPRMVKKLGRGSVAGKWGFDAGGRASFRPGSRSYSPGSRFEGACCAFRVDRWGASAQWQRLT